MSFPNTQLNPQANISTGWSNSKKLSEKYDKYNACANSVVMLSPKQMNHKHVYYKPTIPPESVVDSERWPVQGREDVDEIRWFREMDSGLYDAWVFYCTVSGLLGRVHMGNTSS
jgi:hypothetical protein